MTTRAEILAARPPGAEIVDRLIREVAAREILPRFRRLARHQVTEKGPGDLVTIADIEAERALTEGLEALAPGSRVVGEEGIEADPDLLDALAGEAPVWLVDPVDGTRNFVGGDTGFAVIVAWCHAGQVDAGWIHEPLSGFTAWAGAGGGAWALGGALRRRLRVAGPASVAEMTGSLGSTVRRRMAERLAHGQMAPARMERRGSTGLDYVDLARGRLHFARYGGRLKPWDHAAGVLLHREAGGFAALMADRRPYLATEGLVAGTLLLAPDRRRWCALHRVMDGH